MPATSPAIYTRLNEPQRNADQEKQPNHAARFDDLSSCVFSDLRSTAFINGSNSFRPAAVRLQREVKRRLGDRCLFSGAAQGNGDDPGRQAATRDSDQP